MIANALEYIRTCGGGGAGVAEGGSVFELHLYCTDQSTHLNKANSQIGSLRSQTKPHLKPLPVVDLPSGVGGVGAESQLYGGSHRKPPPLHSEGHEAGAEHRGPHVYVQIWHRDVWLPANEIKTKPKGQNVTLYPFIV